MSVRSFSRGGIAMASVVAALLVGVLPVSAQPAAAQAEVLFRQGRELLAAGKIAEACEAFAESQRLDPTTNTLINLAACREKNQQLASAWGLFLEVARQTRAATDPDRQKLFTVATERANRLEPRVSKLTINVPPTSQREGLEVRRDTETVSQVMWNRLLPVDGGTYTITANAPDAKEWSTKVVVANETDAKVVEVPKLPGLLEPAPPPPVEPKPVESTPIAKASDVE